MDPRRLVPEDARSDRAHGVSVLDGIDTTIGEVRRHMTADAAHGPATCSPPAAGSAR